MPQEMETVTLNIRGRRIPVTVPKGMDDKDVVNYVRQQRPELFQKGGTSGSAPAPPGGGQVGRAPFSQGSMGESFMQGLNPFHQAPDRPMQGPMQPTSAVGKGLADMANLREIQDKAASGDIKGAVGMGAGTAAQLAWPELLKLGGGALRTMGLASDAAKDAPRMAKAARAATETASATGVGKDAARESEFMVQPLFDALNKKFESVHKALSGKAFALSAKAEQLINRLQAASEPPLKKLAQDLQGRSAMDYEEARKLAEGTISDLLHDSRNLKIDHWTQELRSLRNEIEDGIDSMAKGAKKLSARNAYKKGWKEINDLRDMAAVEAKGKTSKMAPVADVGAGMLGSEGGLVGRMGAALRHPTEVKISDRSMARAEALAKKWKVDPKTLRPTKGLATKAGTAIKRTGQAAQAVSGAGAAYRGAGGVMEGDTAVPAQ